MGDVGNGDDAYHNGAFYLAANFGFYTGFHAARTRSLRARCAGSRSISARRTNTISTSAWVRSRLPTKNIFKNQNPYWDDNLKHPTYDEFWQSRAHAQYMKNTTPAVMFVGGWFDAEDLAGPLKLFRAVKTNGPKAPDTLVMGPWRHGGWRRMDGDELWAT